LIDQLYVKHPTLKADAGHAAVHCLASANARDIFPTRRTDVEKRGCTA